MKKSFILSTMTILLLLTGACNFILPGGQEQPSTSIDTLSTSAAQTVVAVQTQMASTAPAVTLPSLPTVPSPVARPSSTPQPSVTNTPNPTATTKASTPDSGTKETTQPSGTCDKGEFVSDITIPDGAHIEAGKAFTKTWRIKNAGTCSWTKDYKFFFVKGDSMSGPASINLPYLVAPGQTIDISVNLKAPTKNGEFQGYWMFKNAAGADFGLGSTANKALWVQIVVGPTPAPFAITSVNISIDKASGSTCAYDLSAKVTSSAAGTVTYYWKANGKRISPVETVEYEKSGSLTKAYDFTWKPGLASGETKSYKIILYIQKPNNQDFGPVTEDFSCP
jgi:hypothetical protein